LKSRKISVGLSRVVADQVNELLECKYNKRGGKVQLIADAINLAYEMKDCFKREDVVLEGGYKPMLVVEIDGDTDVKLRELMGLFYGGKLGALSRTVERGIGLLYNKVVCDDLCLDAGSKRGDGLCVRDVIHGFVLRRPVRGV